MSIGVCGVGCNRREKRKLLNMTSDYPSSSELAALFGLQEDPKFISLPINEDTSSDPGFSVVTRYPENGLILALPSVTPARALLFISVRCLPHERTINDYLRIEITLSVISLREEIPFHLNDEHAEIAKIVSSQERFPLLACYTIDSKYLFDPRSRVLRNDQGQALAGPELVNAELSRLTRKHISTIALRIRIAYRVNDLFYSVLKMFAVAARSTLLWTTKNVYGKEYRGGLFIGDEKFQLPSP